jgi:hypothetical protein
MIDTIGNVQHTSRPAKRRFCVMLKRTRHALLLTTNLLTTIWASYTPCRRTNLFQACNAGLFAVQGQKLHTRQHHADAPTSCKPATQDCLLCKAMNRHNPTNYQPAGPGSIPPC